MKIKLFLISILLTTSPLYSYAIDYFIATANLNVRIGPGEKYSISFTLQKGTEVELISKENNDWYRIKYLEKTGYASTNYLKLSRTISKQESSSRLVKQIVNNVIIILYVILVLFIGFIIYGKIRDSKLLHSVTNKTRGTKSERDLALALLKYGISKENIFHDLLIEKRKGEFSQIDLVIVTQVGIIVFEVKDYSGWIFGNGNHSQWTKVLAYGKQKFYFYNPIMQNNKHIADLKKQLHQKDYIPFFSMIVFYGDCELKNINFVPNQTFIVKSRRVIEVVKTILRDNKPFIYSNENEIILILREAVRNGENIMNQNQHKENIKNMLGTHRVFD